MSENGTLFGFHPGSDLLAELSLEKHNLESLEVGQVLSSCLVGKLGGVPGGRPLLLEAESFDSLNQLLSLLSSVDGGDSELGQLDSLDWDELPLDVGGWAVDQDLLNKLVPLLKEKPALDSPNPHFQHSPLPFSARETPGV